MVHPLQVGSTDKTRSTSRRSCQSRDLRSIHDLESQGGSMDDGAVPVGVLLSPSWEAQAVAGRASARDEAW